MCMIGGGHAMRASVTTVTERPVACPVCNGVPRRTGYECRACSGKGLAYERETRTVTSKRRGR